MTEPLDILLCQRFVPEFGGSIRWMYEVYRRWPRPVEVITHDYYRHPPHTPEFPQTPAPPAGQSDHVHAPMLRMDRRDIFMRDWGLESPDRLRRYWRMTAAVRQRLAQHPGRPVHVHAIHAVPEVVSLWPLKKIYGRRLRILSYVHGEEVTACLSSRQLTFLMRRAHGLVDVMVANSRYTTGVVGPYIAADKLTVVHPGVDLEEFAPAPAAGEALRRQRGWQDRLIVLTVGRLDPRKNQQAVVAVVAQLRARFPNLLYLLAGDGRCRGALEEQCRSLGLGEAVMFLGNVDGALKQALYGACDLFVMPAIRDGTDVEGFGMVFLEAAACGKPAVAGREGGQAEAVRDGETGFVVDGTDPAAVAGALARLLESPPLRRQMGQAGLQHAQEFAWPRVVERILRLSDNLDTRP